MALCELDTLNTRILFKKSIESLRISKERKKNLLQRLSAVVLKRPELINDVKKIQFDDAEINEITILPGRYTEGSLDSGLEVYSKLNQLYHRELGDSGTEEDDNESIFSFCNSEKANIEVRTTTNQKQNSFFSLPTTYNIVPHEPTSGFFFPFSMNYLPLEVLKSFVLSAVATFTLVFNNKTRFYVSKYNYIFEYLTEEEAYSGSLPLSVVSMFSIKSYSYYIENKSVTLELLPNFIDYEEPHLDSLSNDDGSVGSGANIFTPKRHFNHFALSFGADMYQYANRSLHPKQITLTEANNNNDGNVDRFVNHIKKFKSLNRNILSNSYEFDSKPIGRGKFSVVFKGTNIESKPCALKIIKKKDFWQFVEQKSEKSDTLSREIAINLYLNAHKESCYEYFVNIDNILETERLLVFEMEHMNCSDLFQILSKRVKLEAREVQHILQQHKIAHRDIKLSNIVLKKGQSVGDEFNLLNVQPKIIDFGLSVFEDKQGMLTGRCGTPGYIAPEVLLSKGNEKYRNKVDVFSLGVVGFILFVGYEPFSADTEKELVLANRKCNIYFDERYWNEKLINPLATDLLSKMLEKKPTTRQTPKTLLNHPWLKFPKNKNPEDKFDTETKVKKRFCSLS